MKTIKLILICFSITSSVAGQQFAAGLNGPLQSKAQVTIWYADKDRDSFGDPSVMIYATEKRAGYVLNNADFDDNNPSVFPNAYDICDGIDNDNDGQIDEDPFVAELFPGNNLIISKGTWIPIYCTATGADYTYTWYQNDLVIENEHDSYIHVGEAGKYMVQVSTPGGCTAAPTAVDVVVIDDHDSKLPESTASNVMLRNK